MKTKCLLFVFILSGLPLIGCKGGETFVRSRFSEYEIPPSLREKKISLLEVESNVIGGGYYLIARDSIVYKGVYECLSIDNSQFATDSVTFVEDMLNWYSNYSGSNRMIFKDEEELVYDYYEDGTLETLNDSVEKICFECPRVYVSTFKKRGMHRYKLVDRKLLLQRW